MSERDQMLVSLVKELLGPRYGAEEHLPNDRDPRSEYITGVLAPEMDKREDDPDADVDEVIEEASDDEDQGAEGVIIAAASAFSPALDPKSQPRTMGLTFVVTAEGTMPMIDICVTWARYTPAESGGWRREAQGKILNLSITEKGKWDVGLDVDLYMRTRSQNNNHYRVSLYLVNQRDVGGERPKTADYLFQPQIRVCSAAGTKLESIEFASPAKGAAQDSLASEDAQLAMLYRDRVALARGHMCGALWKEIDPERAHPSLTAPDAAPFTWTDRALFTPEVQNRFSPPDIRTEFIPTYPIEAPEWDWRLEYGTSPELDPLTLAETWSPEDIHSCLDPLVEGYEGWIDSQRQRISELNQEWQPFATDNLNQCQQVAQRIRAGIEWLVKDEEVRLAFCFANRAIALQSKWARDGKVVPWRTFQLAFILLNISAIADPTHNDRQICDLLWFPTGGGKTEAYLGVAAFTLALRRRRASQQGNERAGAGVGVLSRYTLRLLTIQQFRRALGLITACEVLRVENLDKAEPTGWRPLQCSNRSDFIWGGIRFSLGLWVGQKVTPNKMLGFTFRRPSNQICYVAGAIAILQSVSNKGYKGFDKSLSSKFRGKEVIANGEPAQVVTCPACNALLAISEDGLLAGEHTLHFMFTGKATTSPSRSYFYATNIQVKSTNLTHHDAPNTHTLSITFTIPESKSLEALDIDRWWHQTIKPELKSPHLLAARPARPGYFLRTYQTSRKNQNYNNFEIYCPNPECFLNKGSWAEQVPVSVAATSVTSSGQLSFDLPTHGLPATGDFSWQEIPPAFRRSQDNQIATRIPIPAYTTDDQVYHRCPSMVVATVDKFARLAFEPKASSLFGNVSYYHARWGYYREGCPPDSRSQTRDTPRPHPAGYSSKQQLHLSVPPFLPPDLIIQDELHLIEGPLGSMVGLYETVIDALGERLTQKEQRIRPKYVASTATVRQANQQVQSLFNRKLCQFPPSAIDVDDRFFARERVKDSHPLENSRAGRLYVAVAAPGKGAQTPIVRIWSVLLEAAQELRHSYTSDALDGFWTLVGYFNALRELAGANALYRQDIRERIESRRPLNEQAVELSSRTNSMKLPGLLKRLEKPWGEDAVLATSMFGTGVDVNRLGLMVVHGQPKTTSAYIQATGRVGRKQGGLVVTFFRASRPRDLDHYEFFTGYHRMLYRFVEPITVTPFAPRARERGLGPLAVALLRQALQISGEEVTQAWRMEQKIRNGYFSNAILMAKHRYTAEVEVLPQLFEERAQQQPEGRRPPAGMTKDEVASELDLWRSIASEHTRYGGEAHDHLVYYESTMLRAPQRGVILGDAQHQLNHFPVAFENAPNSLRDVEETTHFKG